MLFSYSLEEKEKYNVISIKGNLIEKNQAIDLIEEVENLILKESNKFIIDMLDFKYLNSTGLSVLIILLTKTRKVGGEVVICCVPNKIKELLIVTKLNTVFTVTDTLKEAVKKLEVA